MLILGENGTGKEHITQDIHAQSRFTDKPFVVVNCSSLALAFAPSAFFGHVKEAFTGADCNRTEYFQEAEDGTLFLGKVGNLTVEMLQTLLRAIQEHRYCPVGAKGKKTTNMQIITTTARVHDRCHML